MASLKDKVQLQFLKEVPDSIYNMKNFEKLCRAVNNMDHELCNFRDEEESEVWRDSRGTVSHQPRRNIF